MKNKSKKQVENIDSSTEKLLLSDVSVAKRKVCSDGLTLEKCIKYNWRNSCRGCIKLIEQT